MDTTVRTESLNQMIRNKLQAKIEQSQPKAKDALLKLMEEGKISKDFIAPLGVRLREQQREQHITFGANGHVLMNLKAQEGLKTFTMHEHAVGQVGEKLSIPTRYLRDLATDKEWERQLASTILNQHSSWTDRQRVLLRTVGEEVRGVLSDSYKRYNSEELITAFLQEVEANGGVLVDGFLDATRMWFETFYPVPFDIPTEKNGIVTIAFGARFGTSDYGDGAVEERAFFIQGACLNGMVRNSLLRQVHLGARLPDNLEFSKNTYRLDSRTMASSIKDITRNIFAPEKIRRSIAEIQASSNIEVDLKKELTNLSKGKLLKDEVKEIEGVFMRNREDDGCVGESTLWKLTQGISAVARTAAPRRQRELQEIAGELLDRTNRVL